MVSEITFQPRLWSNASRLYAFHQRGSRPAKLLEQVIERYVIMIVKKGLISLLLAVGHGRPQGTTNLYTHNGIQHIYAFADVPVRAYEHNH